MTITPKPFLAFKHIGQFFKNQGHTIHLFGDFLWFYIKKKLTITGVFFEKQKDILVKFLLMKRGRYNRPFLHIATLGVLGFGILIAPFLADTYPIFLSNAQTVNRLPSPNSSEQSISTDENVFSTNVSSNLRNKIITYTVQRGDTLGTIADKFSVSVDTIKWENNLTDDGLSVGDDLSILPVTGIAHKVQPGDTIYSIAKKYDANPQAIADFPYNDFANPETFSLVVGQIIIVPDGVKPSEQPTYQPRQSVEVPQNFAASPGGFIWPIRGLLTQYFSVYHTGMDIAGPVGTAIVAAKDGVVAESECGWSYGYGCHVLLNNGGSFSTMYAHMVSVPAVGVGQKVSQGQVIGYRGNTGRSTGPHTHFEIRINGHVVNPLGYLPQ